MEKQETKHKSKCLQLIKDLLPNYVPLRHEDIRTGGIPDLSLTGLKLTSWWEYKHGTPEFHSSLLQKVTCRRLAAAGYCRYIVYVETETSKSILIIHPEEICKVQSEVIRLKDINQIQVEASCVGHDHKWVVNYMRQVHERAQRGNLPVV